MASDPAHLTLQEYLTWELSQETRHEYVHGLVLTMTGASDAHGTIAVNLIAAIRPRLPAGCKLFASDMKLLTGGNTVRYPDLLVTCDARDRADPYLKRPPKLIVEILSPSTEASDRTAKLDEYTAIPELEEYVTFDSQRVSIILHRRGLGDTWLTHRLGIEERLLLASIDLELEVRAIYEDVDIERRYIT
jgi:Uma2 family endonuclease